VILTVEAAGLMIKTIMSVAILLFFCVLVVLNLDHKTPVNMIWATYENVSVIVVGLVCFVCGIVYSLVSQASRHLSALRRRMPGRLGAVPGPRNEPEGGVHLPHGQAPAGDPAAGPAGGKAPRGPGRRPQ
jgi:hypothetical protein